MMPQDDRFRVMPDAGSSDIQEPTPSKNGFQLEWFFSILLVLALVIATFFFFSYRRLWMSSDSKPADPVQVQKIMDVVDRGSMLIDLEDPAKAWQKRLATGHADIGDYLMRLFISPRYLKNQPDDKQFILDLHQVLQGTPASDEFLEQGTKQLNEAESRLVYLRDQIMEAGYDTRLTVPNQVTRLRTLTVSDNIPGEKDPVVGTLSIDTWVRLTGSDAIIRLYANGHIVDQKMATTVDPSLENMYMLDWDTTREPYGMYELAVFVLSYDGRGRWMDLTRCQVPERQLMASGTVRNGAETGWYQVEPWHDGSIRLIVMHPETTLEVELYTTWNRVIEKTVSEPGSFGSLLNFPSDERKENQPAYVRIRPENNDAEAEAARCVLVSAPTAAYDPAHPDTILAVLEQDDEVLFVRDDQGQTNQIFSEDLTLVDPSARLATLKIHQQSGLPERFAPVFDRETEQYALYVPAEIENLTLSARPVEGSAAQIAVSVSSNETISYEIQNQKTVIPLAKGINALSLVVSRTDGIQKVYTVNILRPPDREGYSKMLDLFPLDWRTPLWRLSVEYPGYRYEAYQTGIDWQTFIDAQSEKDRSLIDASTVPATWVVPDSPVYDGNSWKAAARPVIEYYADPRNFLDPVHLFQFETLTYHPELHTKERIQMILEGTFMAQGQSDLDYAALIDEAGRDANISPFFLASRIVQEMGRNGQSTLSSGTLPGYEGVYNFYNIGATPNPDVPDGARINGARFALFGRNPEQAEITPEEAAWLLPWTTPRRAIIGGARWIAERYVAIGQDTLYGQKFDLVAEDGLFIHQYAQNIQMAWTEGRRTRQAWFELGLIQEPFVFRIPVFENMPAEPALLP